MSARQTRCRTARPMQERSDPRPRVRSWSASKALSIRRSRTPAIQERRLHFLHRGAVVFHEAPPELHHTAIRFAALLLLDDGGLHVERVTMFYRREHAPVIDLQEC